MPDASNDAAPSQPLIGRTGYQSGPVVYNACRSAARWAATSLFDLKVFNVTNVPLSGGVLLVSNHQSYIDPIFIAAKLPRVLAFLAKSELFEPWGFRWLIRNCNAFPVKQGKGDIGAMKQTIGLLQDGHAVLVFPEGSRSNDGKLQEIAAGAALVVKRAKVPVVPLFIEGAFDIWPRHQTLPRTGPVRINFGKPTVLHELDSRAIVQSIGESFRSLHAELHRLDPDFVTRSMRRE
jgi:1-acyl-sn-glycerol-3-phosphate acyltransferase